MAKDNERFVAVYTEGGILSDSGYRQLLVDKETGVTYLMVKIGSSASITLLLNADGTPVLTKL